MLDKEKFLQSRTQKPFTKAKSDSFGEVGVRLIKSDELKPWLDLDLNHQVQFIMVDEKGELIFSEDEIETHVSEMLMIERNEIIELFLECNGLTSKQSEIKKN